MGKMLSPMRRWPAKDAYMTEHLRPLSGLLDIPTEASGKAAQMGTRRHSAMIQRINQNRRKRPAKINMGEFWRLHDQGMSVAEMAVQLGVSTRSVERATAMSRRDG